MDIVHGGGSAHLERPSEDTEGNEATPPVDAQTTNEREGTAQSDIEDGSSASENESESDIIRNVSVERKYNHCHPLEKRMKRAPKRYLQHLDYTHLLEDRVSDLERRLRAIEGRDAGPQPLVPSEGPGVSDVEGRLRAMDGRDAASQPLVPSEEGPAPRSEPPSDVILDIKRMSSAEYRDLDPASVDYSTDTHVPRHEFPGQTPYHLFDVVYSSEYLAERLDKITNTKPLTGGHDSCSSSVTALKQETVLSDGQSVQPDRVRINSILLLSGLEKISGLEFETIEINDEKYQLSQVMLRPFKFFVAFEREIKDEIERLEKLHMTHDDESRSDLPAMVQSESQIPTHQQFRDGPRTELIPPEGISSTYAMRNHLMPHRQVPRF